MADIQNMWNESYDDLGDDNETDLFETKDPQAPAHGELKSFKPFKTKDGGLVYWSDDPSGFTFSVERLLQVDGEDDTEKQRMTLIILKVVLASNDLTQKIKHVNFSMEFEDLKLHKKAEPKLLAWAPFDTMVRSNEVKVDVEEAHTANAKIGASGGGATAEGSLGYEKRISWTETYFDSGHAYPIMGQKTQERSGVRWVLSSNPKDIAGVPPGITVAMLLSRATDEPYLAKFNIRVTGGTLYNLERGIMTAVGMKPGTTKPYKVTPSKKPIMRGEGAGLFKQAKITATTLGKLRAEGELTSLTLVWGKKEEKKETKEIKDEDKKGG